jgi:hypothetical protein
LAAQARTNLRPASLLTGADDVSAREQMFEASAERRYSTGVQVESGLYSVIAMPSALVFGPAFFW